jgi:glycerophosphoryl diester phosphodiesterase
MKKLIYISVIFLSSQTWAKEPYQFLYQRIKSGVIGAHQGGVLTGAQNTLEQFEKARQAGMDIVEMDLHASKDQIPFVFHDDNLDFLTTCHGSFSNLNSEELNKCQFYTNNYSIPKFENVLKWSNGSIIIDAEFKDFESIKPSIELIEKYQAYNWVYFQTQDNKDKYFQARQLSQKVVLLYAPSNEEDLQWALQLKDPALLIIEIQPDLRKPEIIEKIHRAGKLVTEDIWHLSWNRELFGSECFQGLILGIDIVISNRIQSCVRQKTKFYEWRNSTHRKSIATKN